MWSALGSESQRHHVWLNVCDIWNVVVVVAASVSCVSSCYAPAFLLLDDLPRVGEHYRNRPVEQEHINPNSQAGSKESANLTKILHHNRPSNISTAGKH
jgi:hypothetical protein